MTRVLTLHPEPRVRRRRLLRWPASVGRYGRYVPVALSAALLLSIIGAVAFAGALSPHDPVGAMNLSNRFHPPFWLDGGSLEHPLGTDNLGRDVLSRTLHGGQVSLQVAFIAGSISTVFGMALGLVSGYAGGLVDRVLLYISDVWISFPFLVLALAVIAAVGGSVLVLVVLLSLAGWVHAARVTRANTLKLREAEYVHASIAFGATPRHVLWTHIVPGIVNVNLVMWTFTVGTMVLIEGSLSFIGLGVSAGTPSWGNMLSDGRDYLRDAWWMSIFPGAALMLTILAVNYMGDALQTLNNRSRSA